MFFPLVDNFGVWTPLSNEVLRSIAQSSTVCNGLSVGTAFYHLMERLSVQLYWYNACISGLSARALPDRRKSVDVGSPVTLEL